MSSPGSSTDRYFLPWTIHNLLRVLGCGAREGEEGRNREERMLGKEVGREREEKEEGREEENEEGREKVEDGEGGRER